MTDNLELLISWLEAIRDDKEPEVPYTFHKLLHSMCNTMGPKESVEVLRRLQEYRP